jgi:hypothetical protein
VINVPATPAIGEIDITDPIVHGVKRNSSELVLGTVCEQVVGLRSELEMHDELGTESIINIDQKESWKD